MPPISRSCPDVNSSLRRGLGASAARLGAPSWPVAGCAALAIIELMVARTFFRLPPLERLWSNPAYAANQLGLIIVFTAAAFVILTWSRRAALLQSRPATRSRNSLVGALLANLLAFALLLFVRAEIAGLDTQGIPSTWAWLYFSAVISTGTSLALIAAPVSSWRHVAGKAPAETLLALVVAGLVLVAGDWSRDGWSTLSVATLKLSYWMLSQFEPAAVMDVGSRILGAGEFRVQIFAECSGYEGIALILAFLAVYFWVFRAHLRFPNAFCLIPIGIAAVWLFNSVRIAALVSLGAHVSPEMALGGFHSWSGWIAFLIVSTAIMAWARYSSFVWATPHVNAHPDEADPADRLVSALLAPFIASMAATIVASAFAPHDQWLYILKVVAIGGTVWWYRDAYQGLYDRLFAGASVSTWPILSGVAVGMAWIATAPQQATPLGPWLAGLPPALAVTWLIFRAVGSVVLVPIAEELAFRGYLYRIIATLRLEHLTPGQLRFIGLIVSSIAFGILHERWLAAALAGGVYAALLWRSGRISDSIIAHMASNGTIVLWSIAIGQWNLL